MFHIAKVQDSQWRIVSKKAERKDKKSENFSATTYRVYKELNICNRSNILDHTPLLRQSELMESSEDQDFLISFLFTRKSIMLNNCIHSVILKRLI
jgi:hypothetical protein